jgi:hypothetical protein
MGRCRRGWGQAWHAGLGAFPAACRHAAMPVCLPQNSTALPGQRLTFLVAELSTAGQLWLASYQVDPLCECLLLWPYSVMPNPQFDCLLLWPYSVMPNPQFECLLLWPYSVMPNPQFECLLPWPCSVMPQKASCV